MRFTLLSQWLTTPVILRMFKCIKVKQLAKSLQTVAYCTS